MSSSLRTGKWKLPGVGLVGGWGCSPCSNLAHVCASEQVTCLLRAAPSRSVRGMTAVWID